jgi:hypothetical protein
LWIFRAKVGPILNLYKEFLLGKGIVATKDITKGTLLIASKPFSIAYDEDFSGSLLSVNVAANMIEPNSTKLQMVRAIEQVRKNPSKAKELYKLYAGDLPRSADIPEGKLFYAYFY